MTVIDHKLAETLINEFPCRPHWTKNTREVFERAAKNIDPDVRLSLPLFRKSLMISTQHISRFKAVRQKFDPDGIFRSVVGEAIGVY